MEKFQEARERAIKHIKAADHILTQTYPHIKDPKLLIAALDNVYISMNEGMNAILHYLRAQRKIGAFHDSYQTKLNELAGLSVREESLQGKVTKEHVESLRTVMELMESHKESAVEFSRRDAFVISTNNYNLKTVTADTMKNYIRAGKLFVTAMDKVILENV